MRIGTTTTTLAASNSMSATSHVGLARAKSGKKSAIGSSSHQSVASRISTSRTIPCSYPSLHSTDAAACNRVILGAHPIRADRLARALAARSQNARWKDLAAGGPQERLPFTFRTPPAPYREDDYALGPGFCCVCGQPVYRLGWHVDLWKSGPNKNAVWHCACVVAWRFWNAPNSQIQLLRRIQSRRCAQSGGRLWRNAEVDHRVPLSRVWSEHRDTSWPRLLDFWGLPNLQVINRDVHAGEMRDRSAGPARCPHLSPYTLDIDGFPVTGTTSMPRFSPADAVKALLYCGEASVD
jgi:hypothetical protein